MLTTVPTVMRTPCFRHSNVSRNFGRMHSRRHHFTPRAQAPDKAKVEQFRGLLQKANLSEKGAKQLVEIWGEQTGSSFDIDSFRKLLVRRSALAVGGAALQVLLDGLAASSAYNLGISWVGQGTFGDLTPLASAGAFILAGYFAAGFVFDAFTFGAITYAVVMFNLDATAFVQAVKEIANTSQNGAINVDVVDKVNKAISTAKVFDALQKIQQALKEESASGSPTTLADLSAYLVLQNAYDKLNFDAKQYGLTDSEVSTIALEFAKYDLNDDFRLQPSEFEKMSLSLQLPNVTENDSREVFKIIDSDGSGYIDFKEFVAWWSDQLKKPADTNAQGVS